MEEKCWYSIRKRWDPTLLRGEKCSFSVKQASAELTLTKEAAWMCCLCVQRCHALRQIETWTTFSMNTQYSAPVITDCQACVTLSVLHVFRKATWRALWQRCQRAGSVTEESCPTSQKPPRKAARCIPGINVRRCNTKPPWKSGRHNKRAHLQLCGGSWDRGQGSIHFDKLTVVFGINHLQCAMFVCV